MVDRRAVTMQTIADSLGVSRSTVSLALREAPVIAEATRQAVREEADRLGFVPNRSAARLRTHQRRLVGLVVPDFANPLVAATAAGLQRVVGEQERVLLVSSTFEDSVIQRRVLRSLIEEQVGGVIIASVIGTTAAELAGLAKAQIPTVLLNRTVEGSSAPVVERSAADIVDLAFDHLYVEHNARRIAYFGGFIDASPRRDRLEHFASRVAAAGLPSFPAWASPPSTSTGEARDTFMALVAERGMEIDAVICHSDTVAMGVLRALANMGIHIPVVGIDDLDFAADMTPSLTTVRTDARGLGELAGRTLLTLMGSTFEPTLEPALELIVRESCGCAEHS
ncbi:LacI family DNA-binding transcriptional regulator [Microbacterium sp. SSW1-59]|uniref:LacI family DNA-binding transcriptional regulator n=1 Tax=Microbacterium xanthum TaxID=3079794 RepID=UPI002AD54B91|nr:LacI family DNA-binding transcriptional regulator [Microbacterium sp. SSW1-59]MDZ8201690.1 LacI family DNA-binding transcriptional regulator [Microbacterium sp. SSW1-59]